MVARAFHFAACLIIPGVWIFDQTAAPSGLRFWNRALRWLLCPALVIAMISGIGWFACVAVNMSGLPLQQALRPAILRLVWSQTEFGGVWRLRLLFWLACVALAGWLMFLRPGSRTRAALAWLEILAGGLLLASLAWAGHGQVGEPARWHLIADAVHLLIASVWPTGLLPLVICLIGARPLPTLQRLEMLSPMVNRFSAISLVSVAFLAGTGIVNSCFMLGSFSDFLHSSYGRMLLVKITLVCIMVGIGAVNLLRLKPAISSIEATESAAKAAERLRLNVTAEIVLGIGVALIVAMLGLMSPPRM